MAPVYNLHWDPREEHPLKNQGVWAGTPFVRMCVQHLRMKDRFPDWEPARGIPLNPAATSAVAEPIGGAWCHPTLIAPVDMAVRNGIPPSAYAQPVPRTEPEV